MNTTPEKSVCGEKVIYAMFSLGSHRVLWCVQCSDSLSVISIIRVMQLTV